MAAASGPAASVESRQEPAPQRERLVRRLHAGLHADDVGDLLLQARVEVDDEIDGAVGLARNRIEERREPRARSARLSGRSRARPRSSGIVERATARPTLDEEVERIEDRHVGDEIDLDLELGRRLREDEARQPIAVRILLPVHEMIGRGDLQRIAQDGVRECGAGRRRIVCGPRTTGRSYL